MNILEITTLIKGSEYFCHPGLQVHDKDKNPMHGGVHCSHAEAWPTLRDVQVPFSSTHIDG